MDRMIYTAMSGAKALELRQHALSNNLANASTDGFKADLEAFRAVPLRAEGSATTRVFALEANAGIDSTVGPIRQTDSPLDMAIRGEGWFAVEGEDGEELYTRNGAFVTGGDGTLQTQAGRPVVGTGGPIVMPPNAQVLVGEDGTLSTQIGIDPPVVIGQLKLVNPPIADMKKLGNGLHQMRGDAQPPADAEVRVVSGALEGSNVNVVESMVGMIAVSRQFEMQMRMIQNAEANETRAASILARGS
ncbi:MAG: flagellar basal-body rod protein FlgF [Burkholderiaceae bacterium]